jgi:secreted PhoX family phosphatase
MRRREFLKAGLTVAGGLALGPNFWERLYAAPAQPGPSPYGPLQAADINGLMLPAGFTSRVIARAGLPVVPAPYIWPIFPDGAACFPADDGGWNYVVNSETPSHGALPDGVQRLGGASAIHFNAQGKITDAYRVLSGTRTNCAGGATPWGTWLSCEEFDDGDDGGSTASAGRVWECDPTGKNKAIRRDALGAFEHEAAAVDPATHQVYLTEDKGDGRFYRFTPASFSGTPSDLDAGTLAAAQLIGPADGPWNVAWDVIPDPSATEVQTRKQVAATTPFRGGEGCFHDDGIVYFTTKGDNKVWRFHVASQTMDILYDAADPPNQGDTVLSGVDNVVVSRSGDVFVAEDGGNMEIVMITPDNVVAPVLRATGPQHGLFENPLPDPAGEVPLVSEITGPTFSPDGSRLYFSSQRGFVLGITYEVRGPFRATA